MLQTDELEVSELLVNPINHGSATKRAYERTRYFVATSSDQINVCTQPDVDVRKFILNNFKEVDPADLTVGEWQSLLLSGLMVGVTEMTDTDTESEEASDLAGE